MLKIISEVKKEERIGSFGARMSQPQYIGGPLLEAGRIETGGGTWMT